VVYKKTFFSISVNFQDKELMLMMFNHLDSHAKSGSPEERHQQSELLFSSGCETAHL